MRFFKDVDNGRIIRVNPSLGYDVLEQFKDGLWQACDPDGSYAREYWLGEGNCCLFEIDEEVALAKISSQARESVNSSNTPKMTEKEIKRRLSGRAAEWLMFANDDQD